ncbi:MAG: M10 family metallopeptidase C-terminal domain-containing protein, partial [Hyphomicrobium sp.]
MANPYIDVLKGQSWLDVGQDTHIKYYFHFDPTIGGRMWTIAEKGGFTAAAQTWANVANVTFEQVLFPGQAEWKEGLYSTSTMDLLVGSGALGAHELPDAIGTASGYFDGDGAANGYGVGHLGAGPIRGTLSFETFVHEIGHGLGLNHPHADMPGELAFPGVTDPFDTGDLGFNQTVYTVMSYNDFSDQSSAVEYILNGHITGPMAFDIAAIQQMYGANTTFNLGDTVYAIDDATGLVPFWKCLWDAGGIDEMSYAGSDSVVLDLRAATLLSEAGGGGYVSSEQTPIMRGGFTIANGVVIENARGGSGSDVLTGNDASNVLTGNGGDDRLIGELGDDTLLGGSGNDFLFGGGAIDKLNGGLGNDTFVVGGDADVITDDGGNDTLISTITRTLQDSGVVLENITLEGSAAANATGNAQANILTGNGGINILNGRGGADTMRG